MDRFVHLAIETSQRTGSVAVGAGDAIEEEPLRVGRRHDDDLMPAIDRLFKRLGYRPADVSAVFVSIGPGGFTGLRIAVTTAKMVAETSGAALVAVPSALVAAEAWSESGRGSGRGSGPIICALASKAETCWCTRLERADSGGTESGDRGPWRIAGSPGVATAAALDLGTVECLLGDDHLPPSFRARAAEAGVPVRPPIFSAEACLAAGRRLLDAGQVVSALALEPLYPREPEAVSLWAKRREST